jgi:hypothetical protein
MHPSSSGYWSTSAAKVTRPIRHIQEGHRPTATCWSDRFVILFLINAHPAVRDGRVLAGHGLRRHFRRKGENSHARTSKGRAGSLSTVGPTFRYRPGFSLPQRFRRRHNGLLYLLSPTREELLEERFKVLPNRLRFDSELRLEGVENLRRVPDTIWACC